MAEIDYTEIIEKSDGHIEEILQSINADYILDGDWICLQCPFHNGEKYNLKYRNQYFYCFSECNRSYTIIDVVAKYLGSDISSAVEWISQTLGIDCKVKSRIYFDKDLHDNMEMLKKYQKKGKKVKGYTPIPQLVLNDIEFPFYCDYIKNWGISRETAEIFNLGYGLAGEYENRICFPIDAPDGTIISISGRLPHAEEVGMKKYHIGASTDKSLTLYNISRAIHEKSNYIIVVEGMKCVMFLYQNGFRSVVGAMGASLSKEQAKILLRLGKKVIVCGDNDKAGKQLEQSVKNMLGKYLEVHCVNFGDYTSKEKASADDLDFEEYLEFEDAIKQITGD